MNVSSAVLWGFVATLVFTTLTAASRGLGVSRMAIPYLLGTMITPDRNRASIVGFVAHLLNGWIFAFLYVAIFESWGTAGWAPGAGLGLLHGLVVLVALMPLLPGIHPRMASEEQGPEPTRALEPPGFMALNYGRRTPVAALIAHVIFGAILGAFYQMGPA